MGRNWDEGGKEPYAAGYGPKGSAVQRSIAEGLAGVIADSQRTNREGPPPDPSPPLSDEVVLRRLVDDCYSEAVAKQVRAGISRLEPDARARLLREARRGADIFDLLTVAQGGFSKAEMAAKDRARAGR